jgi:hypothetical protein
LFKTEFLRAIKRILLCGFGDQPWLAGLRPPLARVIQCDCAAKAVGRRGAPGQMRRNDKRNHGRVRM